MWLDEEVGNGITRRQHNAQYAKTLGIENEDDEFIVPPIFANVWLAFTRLSKKRFQKSELGKVMLPISYANVNDYCTAHRIVFTSWEVETIMELDEIVLR